MIRPVRLVKQLLGLLQLRKVLRLMVSMLIISLFFFVNRDKAVCHFYNTTQLISVKEEVIGRNPDTANYILLAGTVPANNLLLAGTPLKCP